MGRRNSIPGALNRKHFYILDHLVETKQDNSGSPICLSFKRGYTSVLPMASSVVAVKIVRFGVFEFDLTACELRKHGLRIKLADQPLQVLTLLLEKPGEIVTREELRSRLWQADTFVDFDHGLNNAVMRVREALADSSETPRYVETVPRRGYRFIAPVEGIPVATPGSPPVETSSASALVPAPKLPLSGNSAQSADPWHSIRKRGITPPIFIILVLSVLATRKIPVNDALRQRVLDCRDLNQLERWLREAIVCTSAELALRET